jgi:hypothetical protein
MWRGQMAGNPALDALTKSFMYHLKFAKIVDFGAQGQLRIGDTSQSFNGFGFSLQAAVLPGLKIGGAYNKTYFNPQFTQTVFNSGGTDYWTLGASAHKFIEPWTNRTVCNVKAKAKGFRRLSTINLGRRT